jgi:hypothetical protein
VDRTIRTTAPAAPDRVHAILSDLDTYQHWLTLVHRVEAADAVEGDDGPAWWVTLRAKIGPVARNKRLRMVRVSSEPVGRVRFERREIDAKEHSAWIMESAVFHGEEADVSEIEVTLRYDGRFWNGGLDGALGGAIDGAIRGLGDYVAANP